MSPTVYERDLAYSRVLLIVSKSSRSCGVSRSIGQKKSSYLWMPSLAIISGTMFQPLVVHQEPL